MNEFSELVRYSEVDIEKRQLIHEMIKPAKAFYEKNVVMRSIAFSDDEYCDMSLEEKICPKCRRTFIDETLCPDCLVLLKDELNPIMDLNINPEFRYESQTNYESFDELLTSENIEKINEFDFSIKDFKRITYGIKKTAYTRLNRIIRDNEIDLSSLDILDIVMLFAKSFVQIDYKSQGVELGYFEFNRITIDDRQPISFQITTILHELSHFLVKEILTHVLCRVLDTTKNPYIESLITYELTSSDLSLLIDEYAAHTVEGRFTLFGYQDYSSFLNIQHNLSDEDVSVAKMIGNSFAIENKDIIEGFIDRDYRRDIQMQFKKDHYESPNYENLKYESCRMLTPEGLCRAIQIILQEAFANADLEIMNNYLNEFLE